MALIPEWFRRRTGRAAHGDRGFAAFRDSTPHASIAEWACHVCGHHTLFEDSPHEFARGLTDRLICEVCGAHHVC